jgi:hypothetical protein
MEREKLAKTQIASPRLPPRPIRRKNRVGHARMCWLRCDRELQCCVAEDVFVIDKFGRYRVALGIF